MNEKQSPTGKWHGPNTTTLLFLLMLIKHMDFTKKRARMYFLLIKNYVNIKTDIYIYSF